MQSLYLVLFFSLISSYVETTNRVKRIIGGIPADIPPFLESITEFTLPPTDSPPPITSKPFVFVRRERRSALINGIKNNDGTFSFLGLRYADPPLRRRRFQRPRRLKLRGDIDATRFGPPCPQWRYGRLVGDEDCLFLNIFSPEVPSGDGSKQPANPVLFWIHGGNFKTGSASQYVPTDLVKKGIVIVTVQYRLGSLGFLSNGRKELPGNVGYFDIATALRWVQEYIHFFGGDPRRITPGGQGSGATCATMMALNKHSRRRVNGVFAMSGSPVSPFALDESEIRTAEEVSKETGSCDSKEGIQFVRCMQSLPIETIMKADDNVQNNRVKSDSFPKGLANLLVPGPTEEGKEDERFLPHFILESPMEAIKKGDFPSIPLLTGVTKEETGGGCRGTFFEEITRKLLSPDFLQSGIFTGALQANNGLFVNKTVNPQLSSLFLNADYLKFFTMLISSALSDLQQVVKHTTDAFFNLPAYITSSLWSRKNKVFLYSFEHKPKKSLANEFLSGIPLVSPTNTQKNEKTGSEHGDDLMYLFDIRSLDGTPLENTVVDEVDKKVKEQFCSIVAEFVRSGQPREDWKPFSSENGDYMVIDEKPRLAEKFHKCEMGMWTGDNDILGSQDCSLLNQATEVVTNTIGSAGAKLFETADNVADTLNVNNLKDQLEKTVTNPLDENLGGLVGRGGDKPLGGLLGGGGGASATGSSTTTSRPRSSTTTQRSAGLLGLGGGGFGGGRGLLG